GNGGWQRRFEIFVLVCRFGMPPRERRGATRRSGAESMGSDTLLIADHLADGMLSPLAPLVAAAGATDRLRVGSLVLNNDFRHPVVLAREAATVDMLPEG